MSPSKTRSRAAVERLSVVGRTHRFVSRTRLLLVDDIGHPAQRLLDLLGGHHAVVEPVGDVLAGDPAGRAVLHQLGPVDVGHLRTADTLVDPPLHVAEDALQVVVDLREALVLGPGGGIAVRHRQQLSEATAAMPRELLLARSDVDLVVVQRVQRRRRRRRHPGTGRARLRVTDLLLEHGRHLLGHRPHALADLRAAVEPALEADVDGPVLVRRDPRLGLHLALAHHRCAEHRRVQLVAGPVQEAGVDERDPTPGGMDAGLEVGGGTSLLVHDAELDGAASQPQQVLGAGEELIGEGHLVGAVHLRFHGIHRAGPRVAQLPAALQVDQAAERGHHRVEDPFRDLVARRVQHGVGGHQVPDLPDEQQRATGKDDRSAGTFVLAVRGEPPGEGLPALDHRHAERATVEQEPVPVGRHLVGGVHGGDGVLQVHDRGHGGLDEEVLHPGGIVLPDGVVAVDLDLDVQPVVHQQDALGTGRPRRGARRTGSARTARSRRPGG